MSEIADLIASRREAGSGVLIGYLPTGFPDLQTSIDAAVALAENGVDIIELGLPYSDPVMDGPVIQNATTVALANGFKTADVFTAIREIKKRVNVPILIMAYWNLVLQHGVANFAAELQAVGGAGLITPDLIPDEAEEWLAVSEDTGLDRVFLAAPTSSDERLSRLTDLSRGFVYTVSTMGVTGARSEVDNAARELVVRLRDAGSEAACVGLGISTAEQVRDVLSYADGAIVGSAFVRALTEGGVEAVAEVAKKLAEGKQDRR